MHGDSCKLWTGTRVDSSFAKSVSVFTLCSCTQQGLVYKSVCVQKISRLSSEGLFEGLVLLRIPPKGHIVTLDFCDGHRVTSSLGWSRSCSGPLGMGLRLMHRRTHNYALGLRGKFVCEA